MHLEVLAELLRIHVVRALVDVDEIGTATRLRDRFGGRDECIRNRDHRVARLDSSGDQSKPKRIGTVGYAHAVFSIAKRREIALKLLHHRTADKASGTESFREDLAQFFL